MREMRTILITGANSAIASAYIAKHGDAYDQIIAHYGHRRDRIDELVSIYGSKVFPVCADLAKKEEVDKLVSEIKDYEINEFLHLAAPTMRHMRFTKGDPNEFEVEMQVVCWSFLRICQAIIPKMAKIKDGRILAVLTEYTVKDQPPYLSHYITAKFALLGLIKCIASEYASKGIRANGISPGMIETDFIQKLPQYVIDDNAKNAPNGRILRPDDLVSTIDYLLGNDSAVVNGQNILLQ